MTLGNGYDIRNEKLRWKTCCAPSFGKTEEKKNAAANRTSSLLESQL
jgi:hypothetical protein